MLRLVLNKLWLLVAALLVLVAVAVSLARVLLPELPRFRAELEREAGARLGVPVHIGAIEAGWALGGPELHLLAVGVGGSAAVPELALARVDLALDVWRSALQRRPVARRFQVSGVEAAAERDGQGRWRVRGLPAGGEDTPLDTAVDFLLAQRELSLADSRLRLIQPGKPPLDIELDELSLLSRGEQHQLAGAARLAGSGGESFRLVLESQGDPRLRSSAIRAYVASRGQWLPELPLPRLEGYELARAGVDGELWAQRSGGRWASAQARLHVRDLVLSQEGKEALSAGELSARLRFAQDGQGWRLYGQDIALRLAEGDWQPFDLRVEGRADGEKRLALSRLDLAQAAALARRLPFLPAERRQALEALAPQGRVEGVQARWRKSGEAWSWQAAGALVEAGWRAHAGVPGVQALSARLAASEAGGVAAVAHLAGAELAGLFREPFAFRYLRAGASWSVAAGGWRLAVPGAALATEDASAIASLDLVKPAQGSSELSLYAELHDAVSDHAGRYFPYGIMTADLVRYLDESVRPGGRLPFAHIAMHGPLEHFPFDNAEGVFSIAARAQDLPFRFQPDWPLLEGTGADLYFEGDGMRIVADAGNLLGVRARRAEAQIPQLSADNPLLSITAAAEGEGARFSDVVAASPLPKLLGEDVAALRLSGPAATELRLDIPLNTPEAIKIDGKLLLADTRLDVQPLGTLLTGLKGELRFTEQAVSAKAVTGRLLGEPLRLDLGQRRDRGQLVLNATARGQMSAEALQALGLPLAGHLDGRTGYTAVLAITPRPDGSSGHRLSVVSDLQGLAVDLPAPVGHDGSGQVLSVDVDLEAETVLRARYADSLSAIVRWRVDEAGRFAFDRASLMAGDGKAALPDRPGLFITGAWAELSAEPWVALARELAPETRQQPGAAAAAGPALFQGLALEVDELDLYGVAAHQAEVELVPSPEGLAISLESAEIAGRMLLPEDPVRQALVLELERAWLPAPPAEEVVPAAGAAEDAPDLPFAPQELPRLQLSCADCRYGQRPLGRLRLSTEPAPEGLAIREFRLHNGSSDLAITGRWLGGAGERTELRGQLNSPDIGRFAKDWGLAFSARESPLAADFELAWPGDPAQFALKNLDGFLNGRLGQGHLAEVSDQGARLFSLFSLQTLRRRLSLDFSDVFGKGFYYNSITGGFRIEDGVATTDDTRIDGIPAGVSISGKTDLGNKTFDQSMRVSPKVSSSLPALAGWAVEPTMALVVLALNTVLSPALEVFTRIDYRVTGPWDQPVIQEVGKTKGKVALPAANEAPPAKSETQSPSPEKKP